MVETWSTVEERHAERQWAAFAGLGLAVFLVVPSDTLSDARRIAIEPQIDVKLVGFVEKDGVITFHQEIIPPR